MPAVFEPKSIRKEYSEKELADLREKYTPAQMEAIQASEEDMNKNTLQQARQRADPWSLNYFDDLSEVHPVVDKPIRAPASNTDPNLRLKTGDELAEDLARFVQNYPDSPKDADSWIKWQQKLRLTVGKPEAEFNPRSAMAPELTSTKPAKPKKKEGAAGGREEEEASPALVRLMQMTGYNRQQIAGLRVKSIISHNVVNQTRLGKIRKQYFLSIAGNGQGLIGIGEGKAEEPQEARLQSQYRAIRNMQPILRYEGRTIFGDVTGKVSATELELYARPPGKQATAAFHLTTFSPEQALLIHPSVPQVSVFDANNTSGRYANVPESLISPHGSHDQGTP